MRNEIRASSVRTESQVSLDVANVRLHTADIGASADAHVAVLGPLGTPRVADDPVAESGSAVFSVADHSHGVVQVTDGVAAVVRLVNARPVNREHP